MSNDAEAGATLADLRRRGAPRTGAPAGGPAASGGDLRMQDVASRYLSGGTGQGGTDIGQSSPVEEPNHPQDQPRHSSPDASSTETEPAAPASQPVQVEDTLGQVAPATAQDPVMEGPAAQQEVLPVTEPDPAEAIDGCVNGTPAGADVQQQPAVPPVAETAGVPPSDAGVAKDSAVEARQGYDADTAIDRVLPIVRARATTGWRSWFGLRPSSKEEEDRRSRAEMCSNFGEPVWFVTANPRGSAGKTPTALGLAASLGLARGGKTLAFEAHELRGTMAHRTEDNCTSRSVRDFVSDIDTLTPDVVRHADVARYARHQVAGQYDAMVSPRKKEQQLTGEEFRAAHDVLGRFYECIVVDTANNEDHSLFRAAMQQATVLIVPLKWRPTVVVPAIQMLESEWYENRRLVENAIIVASNGPDDVMSSCRDEFLPLFQRSARDVIEIPTDGHIHSDGVLHQDQLREATRRAYDRVGAAAAAAARDMLRS